jgi:pumilio RNA-binding family
MIRQCVEIACHKHGCCVMQKCIDGADTEQKMLLTYEIAKHTRTFVKNPYGNYVVQYVLELKNVEVNKRIGQQLLGNLLMLGREKFSSNVIEKCLEHNCMDVKEAMVKEILSADSFYEFLLDQYGNYVI